MAVRITSMLRGRDRMRAVLAPHLGHHLALERANNIAQVLVLDPHDPQGVALGMLRHVGLPDPDAVANEVGRAWEHGIDEAVA